MTEAGTLVVRTRQWFASPASRVWPLLCDSEMADAPRMPFLPGVPQPVECRLPEGEGGVGAGRECISRHGAVRQRILEWDPDHRLAFRMEQTDLGFREIVEEMVDTIDLAPSGAGVLVTRSTRIRVKGRLQLPKKWILFLGVKQVHRYVFRSWVRSSA